MIEDVLRPGLVSLYTPEALGIVLALALSSFIGRFTLSLFQKDDLSKFPLVNRKKWWELTAATKQYSYDHAKDIFDDTPKNVNRFFAHFRRRFGQF